MKQSEPMNAQRNDATPPTVPSQVSRWVLLAFLIIAGYFLLAEHRAHVIQFLPFVLLLACPLLHLFHHHGHDRRRPGDERRDRNGSPIQRKDTQ